MECHITNIETERKMIVDVYDLTATLCCSRYQADAEQCSASLIGRKRFSDVLIYPDASKNRNRPSYLQEWDCPIIRDLVDENGEFHYRNCSFLPDFFQQENQDVRKIADFFRALQCSSYKFDSPADRNVILIPDNFDANLQENILRSCALPRENTSLLWRSVAICLGNADTAQTWHTKIEITDCQRRYTDVTELTLCWEDGLLVPQRKAYRLGNKNDKHVPCKIGDPHVNVHEFYRRTYCGGEAKDAVIWNAEKRQFERSEFTPTQDKTGMVRFFDGQQADPLFCPEKEADAFSASDGAALYMTRREGGRLTYYDECTGLYIVVQDDVTEDVYAKELIPPNSRCKGGEEIPGQVYTDCFIEKGSDRVGFRLSDDSGDETPLKKLDYNFGIRATEAREPLKLHPSMKPGQGIARVRVTGEKQLTEAVELDLLTMEDAKETIKSLRENLPRSFPIDIPAIKANTDLWKNKVRGEVGQYLCDKRRRDKKMFARCRSENSKSQDVMEKLKRINVFGYAKGMELPDKEYDFDHLFKEMADDFNSCCRHRKEGEMYEVLAMISRTYQGNNAHFRPIKEKILKEVKKCVDDGESINLHKMTACAYLLRDSQELRDFFSCYLKKLKKSENLGGTFHWHRVMVDLLMTNCDMLENVPTEDCEQCMIILLKALAHGSLTQMMTCSVLKVCLFLLMKRKYDKSFLRQDEFYKATIRIIEEVQRREKDVKVKDWCRIVLKFVKGDGRLNDLVQAVDFGDDGR